MVKKLKSKPPDGVGMRERVEVALRRHELGEPLGRREAMIVQWVRHGGWCVACASRVGVSVKLQTRKDRRAYGGRGRISHPASGKGGRDTS